jgi:Na+/H+ antiporter NhaD/arsenite permease-like protein
VGNGANAGNLSPISAIGALVQQLMARIDLAGHDWVVWATNFVAHALVAVVAWLLFGGRSLRRAARVPVPAAEPLHWRHGLTLGVLALWVLGVLVSKLPPGLSAFAAVTVLVLAGAAQDTQLFAPVPWAVLTMVCGVSVLVGVLEKTGGMELFSALLARLSTPATVNGVLAGVTGLLSTYSSTSGVVYPAFLPAIPGMVERLGGGDPLQMALSVNVGSAIVDVSPLSTLGALCIAAVPTGHDTKRLFRALLLWGFAMVLVGAAFAQWVVPLLAA